MTSIRTVAASLLALGLAAALAGCGTGPASTTSASTSSRSSVSPSPNATASARPTGTSTAEPVTGQCATSALAGSIAPGGGGAAGHVQVTLVLTNNGATECSLQGWPGVSFVTGENGSQVGKAAEFDRSTPHPVITLTPGAKAAAPLQITQALNYSSDQCNPQKPAGLRVYPPGSTSALFVPYTAMTACASDSVSLLTVGALAQG